MNNDSAQLKARRFPNDTIEKNGVEINRRTAMVNAARDYLSDQGYALDDRIEPDDKDRAIAAIIELSDDDWMIEAQSEMYIATQSVIKTTLINALIDSKKMLELGCLYAHQMSLYFTGIFDEACTQLPYHGPSDHEEWSQSDFTRRAADLRAEGF